MPFGLSNTQALFQAMINHIFRNTLDKGMSAFMDNIIIWSQTLKGLPDATIEVLQHLQHNWLCIAPDKYEWVQPQIEFQGYMVSGQGVEMTDKKVETLKKIEPVKSLKDVHHFLGFSNFYQLFIKDYSKSILPMTNSMSLEKHEWQSTLEIKQVQIVLTTVRPQFAPRFALAPHENVQRN